MVKIFPHYQGLINDNRLANRDNLLRLIAVIFSVSILASTFWVLRIMLENPYYGFRFNTDGYIYEIDTSRGLHNQIRIGDYLFSIDGYRIGESSQVFLGDQTNKLVELMVITNTGPITIRHKVIKTPLIEVIYRIIPIFIALIFMISGLIVVNIKPNRIIAWIFYLITQVVCIILTAGSLTTVGLYWSRFPYLFGIMIVSALSVHFHLHFPKNIKTRYNQILLLFFYLMTFFGGFVAFQSVFSNQPAQLLSSLAQLGSRVLLLISSTTITLLLIYCYRSKSSLPYKENIRIPAVGGLIGLVPITYFSILPDTVFGEPIIAYPISFIPLAILPISYGYSIFKYQLIPKNVQIARPTVQVLTSTISVAIYMVIMVLISQLVSPQVLGEPVFLFLMILLLAGLSTPTRSLIKRSLEKALIGGTFDLPWVISSSNKMVTESKSLSILADQLQTILRKMQFSNAALMVPEKGFLTSLFHYGFSQTDLDLFNFSLDGFLPGYLLELGQPIWTNQLAQISSDHRLSDSELAFLSSGPPVIVVPLLGRSELRGTLILQPEFELDWTSDQDLFVLATLSNFLSVALDNAGFLDSMSDGAEKDHQSSDESLDQKGGTSNGKESEFQSIARELHDGPIQDLVGFGFELKKLQFPSIEQEGIYEHKLNSIIRELREICTNLRPASLYLGVTTAIQSLILRFQENYPGIQFHLTLKGEPVEVGGEMNLALYRITQEAMNNVVQHAKAKNLWVSVEADGSQIQIMIRDDGNGFVIPVSWFRFANEGHFGIMGMSERVQAIDGVFDISSVPGQGTCLRVVAPLTDS